MKLRNSTRWGDPFLRKMIAWVCRELDMPVRSIRSARFHKAKNAYNGMAWGWCGKIRVAIGDNSSGTIRETRDGMNEVYVDDVELLVYITAHECYHVAARVVPHHQQSTRAGRSGSGEAITRAAGWKVLRSFRERRQELLANWDLFLPTNPKPSARESRAMEAEYRLSVWQKKSKLAATKIRKYKARVAYYTRTLAKAAESAG